jgi:hypothetical protein
MAVWDCACGAPRLAAPYCPFCGRTAPEGFTPPPPPLPLDWAYWRPPQPPRVGWTWPVRVLTALVAALLAVGVVAVGDRLPDDEAVPTVIVTPTPKPPPPELTQAVNDARAFVERYRGRPFKRTVEVRLLGDAAFRRALNASGGTDTEAEPEDEDPADFGSTLHGLHLADPGDDEQQDEQDLLDDSVVGFYDQYAKRLYVRGAKLTSYTRLVIVHELTHAWQDQWFDLTKLDEAVGNNDEDIALRSLVEGDATRTEDAWRAEQPRAVRDEISATEDGFDAEAGDDRSRATLTLAAMFGFPYEVGPDFVEALAKKGGNAAIDRAFARPPVSTEQVLHPERYLTPDAPTPVATPSADGTVIDRGTLGEVGLILVVGQGELDEKALRAAAGWDGDAYVTWKNGSKTCTRLVVAMDDTTERDALLAALHAGPFGEADAVGGRAVLLLSCQAA